MSWNSCDVEKHVYLSRAQVARSDEHQSIGDEDMGLGKGRNDMMMLRRMRRKMRNDYMIYMMMYEHIGLKGRARFIKKKDAFLIVYNYK